jgi:hypothetical protein
MPRPKRAKGTTTKIQVRITDDEKSTLLIQADKAGPDVERVRAKMLAQ